MVGDAERRLVGDAELSLMDAVAARRRFLVAGPEGTVDGGVAATDAPDPCLTSARVGPAANAFRKLSPTCTAGFLPVTVCASAEVATPDDALDRVPG